MTISIVSDFIIKYIIKNNEKTSLHRILKKQFFNFKNIILKLKIFKNLFNTFRRFKFSKVTISKR